MQILLPDLCLHSRQILRNLLHHRGPFPHSWHWRHRCCLYVRDLGGRIQPEPEFASQATGAMEFERHAVLPFTKHVGRD
jgi:hypothetical protein